ncbi:HNH endonuclease [Bradyrhizobium sp. CCBAU 51627]|uniref:HNH endonuclease n=1 Tax=Bradyrhizobium sp. CCBAU 51627 TaxID=1325088 RepID=UPI003FA447F1
MPTRPQQFRPPQWRPYVRPVFKSDAFYKSAGWRTLRAACLQRDGNRCTEQFCTTPTDRLTAHHIIERGTPGSTDTLANLRTLCMRCHNRQHGQRGRRAL